MKRLLCILMTLLLLTLCACAQETVNESSAPSDTSSDTPSEAEPSSAPAPEPVMLTEDELYDKILGSWVGQAAGVVWGATTEFKYGGKTIPESDVPDIATLDLSNVFYQDDLYVEIPFLDVMLQNGIDCDIKLLADAFADTQFPLWHANMQGRLNIRNGIYPPDSGYFKNNYHSDDIDWQIESDFVGVMYPGLVSEASAKAFELGHITNYGDGVYGGVFVTAMHSAAFFAADIREICDAGIAAIPDGTMFKDTMLGVVKCFDEGKTWEQAWKYVEDNWAQSDRCLDLCTGDLNIDAKVNAAYVLIGMLYGEGDFDKSIEISMRCGQDSDCNPSTVGAIIGNFIGYKAIDSKWKNFDMTGTKFQYTDYTLEDCVQANLTLAKKLLGDKGFSVDGGWSIVPEADITPVPFEQWDDAPAAELTVKSDNGITSASVRTAAPSGIKEVSWDMGDGTTYTGMSAIHRYAATGTYTVTCTVTDNAGRSGSYTAVTEVTTLLSDYDKTDAGKLRNIAKLCSPYCTVMSPQGVGNKSLSILTDGKKGTYSTDQYDTFAFASQPYEQGFTFFFPVSFDVEKVVFSEGNHFDNGGWFKNGDIRLEYLIDGEWKDSETATSPAYPVGDTQSAFGAGFESYTFECSLKGVDGIRVTGTGGGTASFISASEIEIYAVESEISD